LSAFSQAQKHAPSAPEKYQQVSNCPKSNYINMLCWVLSHSLTQHSPLLQEGKCDPWWPCRLSFWRSSEKIDAVVAQLMFSDKEGGSIHSFPRALFLFFLQTSSSCLRTAPTASN